MLQELPNDCLVELVAFLAWPGALVAWAVCCSLATAAQEVLDNIADEEWVPLRYEHPGRQLGEFVRMSGLQDLLDLRTANPNLEWSAGNRVTVHKISGWLPRLPPQLACQVAPQWGWLPPGSVWLQGTTTHEKWYSLIWRQVHLYANMELRCERVGMQACWHGFWIDISRQINTATPLYPENEEEEEAEEDEEDEEDLWH